MSITEGDLDVEVIHEREEGEIVDSDVEDGIYVPLERPESFNPPSLVHMQIQDEHSDEASLEDSTGSESDDDIRRRPKRTKTRPRRPQSQQGKRNKYNIWCSALQEDLLTEDMVSCDVTKNRRYGVESYDYTIKYRLDDSNKTKAFTQTKEPEDTFSNKRTHSDRKNLKLRLGKRENIYQPYKQKQQPRTLLDLTVTIADSVTDIAKDIAEKLSEEKLDLILRLVEVLGASKAIEIYEKTQKVEADGGMQVMNGARRRTPGGVYFFLLKRDNDVTQCMVSDIFQNDRKESQRRVKRAKAKSRQKVVEELKQSLNDSELPALLSRGEAVTGATEHGSNPPPSPATDARDCSSDTDAHSHTDANASSPPRDVVPNVGASEHTRNLHDDDDFLEVMYNDDMDLF